MKKLTVYGIPAGMLVIAGLMGTYFKSLGSEQWVLVVFYAFSGISIVSVKDFLNDSIR